MQGIKKIWDSLNVFKQCREYNVGIRQCPQFLFLLMGGIIIIAIITTNAMASKFADPGIVALIVLVLTAILFAISHVVISSFERIANSSKAKSDFISIMSHRLRAPLSAVKWHMDLLTGRRPTLGEEETEGLLLEIERQNEKMIRIANDLLELNNIEDNNLLLNPSSFSLKYLMEEIMRDKGKYMDDADSPIFISAPEALPDVFADRPKIKNIIFHLLDNAARYSLKKGKITVAFEQMPDYIRCSVSDEGVGVSEKDRGKIFSKFFRGNSGNLRYQTEGTGIGLFIARAVIEHSGGQMGFSSIEGRGSTFWFTLPITK